MCIGFLDANIMGCIVDTRLAPVPVGVAGELLISGPKVGRGKCSDLAVCVGVGGGLRGVGVWGG